MTVKNRIGIAILIGLSGALVFAAMIAESGDPGPYWWVYLFPFAGAALAGLFLAPFFGRRGGRGLRDAFFGAIALTFGGAALAGFATIGFVALAEGEQFPLSEFLRFTLVGGPMVVGASLILAPLMALYWVACLVLVHLAARYLRAGLAPEALAPANRAAIAGLAGFGGVAVMAALIFLERGFGPTLWPHYLAGFLGAAVAGAFAAPLFGRVGASGAGSALLGIGALTCGGMALAAGAMGSLAALLGWSQSDSGVFLEGVGDFVDRTMSAEPLLSVPLVALAWLASVAVLQLAARVLRGG